MKRDLDLIRKMVLAMEEAPTGYAPEPLFDGYTPAQVGYHAYLWSTPTSPRDTMWPPTRAKDLRQ